MKNNNQKPSNKIYILLGSIFLLAFVFILVILLLTINKPQLNMQPQKAKDKTYNKIISKSNKKVDSLTQTKQRIRYRPDGKTIEQIYEYNENNKLIKKTDFNFGDKTINYIIEYDPQTGNMIKLTNYNFQDKTINYIIEYDPHFVSKKIKKTFYKPDGTVREVLNF